MNIIYPLLAMVLLTFLVTLRLLYFTLEMTLTGEIHIKHFRLFDDELPAKHQAVRQHYKNMFEMPLLFYLLGILLLINNNFTQLDVIFAWGFVGFRYLHSLSRVPNRDVNLRFGLFAGSFVMLIAGWVNLALKYLCC